MRPSPARRALVVDDDDAVGVMLCRLLERRGFESAMARGTEEALAAAAGAPPDLVLLDLGLQGESGWRTLSALRARCSAPVVIMTGGGVDAALRLDARLLGASGVLAKPFTGTELDEMLSSLWRT